ncbi:hypothetical protein KAJ87_03150 [Candidatus Pacearchaeota archaeon]|nr:hypothetical protein [Candidatus Pacearchaeota archaeon]
MADADYKRKLVNYFKKNLSKGYTSESLKWALINQGYSKAIIEQTLEEAHKELAEKVPEIKEKPKIKYEVIDEYGKPITIKKSFWKRILRG